MVELALVLAVLGLLLGSMLRPLGQALQHHRQQQAKAMLRTATERIEAFALINGRLPCPSSEPNPQGQGYGAENCAAVETEGPLPWRTLDMQETDPWGSPRHDSSQPWAGYLHYRADPALARDAISPSTINDKELTIVVMDGQGRQLTNKGTSPAAIVCSYGKDRTANGENKTTEPPPEATYQTSQVTTPAMDDQCMWVSRLSLLHRMLQMQ